jgi:dolichyl-phosphate beta-glucosyltransferase
MKERPYLTIIIPTYNEAKRIGKTLDAIADFLKKKKYSAEVLVVDGGSTDGTRGVVKVKEYLFKDIKFIDVSKNVEGRGGKGYAVRCGVMEAKGRYVMFLDADNSTPISEVDKLLPYMKEYAVVIGSRYLKRETVKIKQPWYRILLSRAGNLLIKILVLPGIKDTQCGFKMFRQITAKKVFCLQYIDGWGFDMEILTITWNLGYKIKEVPVSWYDAGGSKVHLFKDSLKTLSDLLKIKWNLITGKYNRDKLFACLIHKGLLNN